MNKFTILFSLLLLLTGCGGGTSISNPPPPPPATISANVNISSSTGGAFDLAMSTSFQPAEWDYQFFQNVPSAVTPLGNLNPHHIRLQGISRGVPQGINDFSSTAWDFSTLDAIVQPVLNVGDQSPEFQIAKGPAFMYQNNNNNSTNNIPNSFLDLTFQQFAGYAKNLVQYYNTGGFTPPGGSVLVSAAYPADKITWWGIYNEPSINNNLDEAQYTTMYNAVVPAMRSADSSIKFVALELCCGSESWASYFASNVTAPVDAVATHYYSSCNQRDTDAQLMATVPGFASSVTTIYSYLQNSGNPLVMNAPVWITENNVNADFNAGNNMSACNPGQTFVTDQRGTSAFFAAWRPYVFSQVGKAGAHALYHWDFDADQQYGEVDVNTGNKMLSYWVDYWLGQYFPTGNDIPQQLLLDSTNSNAAQVEVLPVLNADGSVVIMVSNHAVASSTDNNGTGLTAHISIDMSAFGRFSSASELVIDSTTSATNGTTATSISAASPINFSMNGYSVAFIKLTP